MIETFITNSSFLIEQPFLFYSVLLLTFLFLGEPVVLAFATLSASYNLISPFSLTVIAFVTAICAEFFWFLLGKTPWAGKILSVKRNEQLELLLRRFSVNKPFPLLFISRFFTGVSILAIIYFSRREMKNSTFLYYSALVNIIWTPGMVAIGYLAGKGYVFVISTFEAIHTATTLLLITMVVLFCSYYLLKRRLVRTFSPLPPVPDKTQDK